MATMSDTLVGGQVDVVEVTALEPEFAKCEWTEYLTGGRHGVKADWMLVLNCCDAATYYLCEAHKTEEIPRLDRGEVRHLECGGASTSWDWIKV